jgi:hypothetical protein
MHNNAAFKNETTYLQIIARTSFLFKLKNIPVKRAEKKKGKRRIRLYAGRVLARDATPDPV